jgi:hypothetical protein
VAVARSLQEGVALLEDAVVVGSYGGQPGGAQDEEVVE